MRFLLRVIPIFILVMVGLSLLRAFMNPNKSSRQQEPERKATKVAQGGKLVKDPVCGTYVTPDGSLTTSSDGESYFFCSEDCQNKFLSQAS
jgi:YHS domain-containing protein